MTNTVFLFTFPILNRPCASVVVPLLVFLTFIVAAGNGSPWVLESTFPVITLLVLLVTCAYIEENAHISPSMKSIDFFICIN